MDPPVPCGHGDVVDGAGVDGDGLGPGVDAADATPYPPATRATAHAPMMAPRRSDRDRGGDDAAWLSAS